MSGEGGSGSSDPTSGPEPHHPWPRLERSPGPLNDLKVLDLSRVLAGPYAAMLMADLGADVLKVEHPRGDATRHWGPPFLDDTAVYFLAANRNKRSIVADFADHHQRAMVRSLAYQADVIIENFKVGALKKHGLDHRSVARHNPDVIYCSISGFGSDSELADRGGYDLVAQAMGGMMHVTGEPGRPPVKVGVASADLSAGMYAAIAVLGALTGRERHGHGCRVEVALLDAQVAFLANQAMNWLAGSLDPPPMGNAHPNVVPYQAFETSTGYIVVAVGGDLQFQALCNLLGQPERATDERFATNAARVTHREELVRDLEAAFRRRPSDEWLAKLDTAGIPCGPVRSVAETFQDPFVAHRMVEQVPRLASEDAVPQVRSPFRIDGRPPPIDLPPPGLGAHNDLLSVPRKPSGATDGAHPEPPTGSR